MSTSEITSSSDCEVTNTLTSTTQLQHVSLLSSELTTKEQLEIYCKPTCRLRRLKNKGAILILVWNYLLASIFYFNQKSTGFELEFDIQLGAIGFTLPVAGWLADVYFGRFQVIRFSIWIMWISFMLATASSVVTEFIQSYSVIDSYIFRVLMILASIGLAAFQANAIQFGMDQLHDASTNEVKSFVIWYVWTGYISGFVTQVAFECLPKEYWNAKMLVMCVLLSITLCSLFSFNHLLVKEPVTHNPFKLVYSVIKYAIKNKHPKYRSAFTYCEDDLPSRIDFGKSKYGGPFTTEQVEDVKTFIRFLTIIVVGSVSFGVVFASDSLTLKISKMLSVDDSKGNCYVKQSFIKFFTYIWAIMLPLYEFFVYPMFHWILVILESQRKFVLGTVLLTATIISLMILETFVRHTHLERASNVTVNCGTIGSLSEDLDYRWIALPYTFRSISIAALATGGFEFIVSQVPYSMRGLIMGTSYGVFLLSATVAIVISIPFTRRLSIWGNGIISCGFWHALLLLAIEITAALIFAVIQRRYKRRKREDILPNEHIFAERYYER